MGEKGKVLVIRFSSIGDIVLTTPVIRCLSKAGYEVHLLTKAGFSKVLDGNPYIHTLHAWENTAISNLKKEQFTFIADLHNNLRSRKVKLMLRVKSKSFPKLNLKKTLLVNWKVNKMPDIHVVDRYFESVKSLGVVSDGQGLDYFGNGLEVPYREGKYEVIVLGAAHGTKQIPESVLLELIWKLKKNVVLVGGPAEKEQGDELAEKAGDEVVFNTCGQTSLDESANLIKFAQRVFTPDTGMMHIASAFHDRIVSFWGNTVPELGMTPYFGKGLDVLNAKIMEVKGLDCRPCSKIGYDECPKGHFNCMMQQDLSQIKRE
ncbi:MAG: ADP-heptose:LPS heptosyltransferase [Sphingobacteriales bacterium]|jgi:ADP-heptose:LPS heptosyltransferase